MFVWKRTEEMQFWSGQTKFQTKKKGETKNLVEPCVRGNSGGKNYTDILTRNSSV